MAESRRLAFTKHAEEAMVKTVINAIRAQTKSS
jgi:hypothetical protein